jgi:ornithine cyclodeaminase
VSAALPYLDAATVREHVSMARAVDTIETALREDAGVTGATDRDVVDVPAGQLLLMPAASATWAGVKVASVAPHNPARGLPRIQGVYLLLDGASLSPVALLDGAALTTLRTPAVSAVAARYLADPAASRLVVFGTGPQAWGHVEALSVVRPIREVAVVARDSDRTGAFVSRCRDSGLRAWAAKPEEVRDAEIVACCTTARAPLFPSDWLPGRACVLAVGSHEPDTREVDGDLVRRATVVVETRQAALREAGDILVPMHRGEIDRPELTGLADVVRSRAPVDLARPRLFKSVGMAWEDLAVAAAAVDAFPGRSS